MLTCLKATDLYSYNVRDLRLMATIIHDLSNGATMDLVIRRAGDVHAVVPSRVPSGSLGAMSRQK